MFNSVYIGCMKRKHGKPMTFAQATQKELREAFGPQWVASASMWVVVAGCLILAAMVGMQVIEVAHDIGDTLTGLAK